MKEEDVGIRNTQACVVVVVGSRKYFAAQTTRCCCVSWTTTRVVVSRDVRFLNAVSVSRSKFIDMIERGNQCATNGNGNNGCQGGTLTVFCCRVSDFLVSRSDFCRW